MWVCFVKLFDLRLFNPQNTNFLGEHPIHIDIEIEYFNILQTSYIELVIPIVFFIEANQ